MKSDVLSGFDKIKVCIAYEFNGKTTSELPYDINSSEITPIYKSFDCWKQDISNIKSVDEIPEEFKNYIEFLEKELCTPISIISVGPDRSQTIFR